MVLDPLDEVEAVAVRQAHVGEYEVVALAAEVLHGARIVSGGVHLELHAAERDREQCKGELHEQQQRAAGDRVAANRIQVRVELQADCFAGVWASRSEQSKQFLDPGDIDAALQTATAIGDDTLQRNAGRNVAPERPAIAVSA